MSEVPYPFPKSPANDVAARTRPASIARGLGWFSLALGAAELLAPNSVARAAGVRTNSALMRLYGLREIACGIGILMSRDPTPYLWARVGGMHSISRRSPPLPTRTARARSARL